jgi:hypothetical protein
VHYRSFVRPGCGGRRNPASMRDGSDDPEMRDRAFRQLDGADGVSIASHPIWIGSTGGPPQESPTWPSLPRCR